MNSEAEEIQNAIKAIFEMIYEMYVKDLKSGNIQRDKSTISFGKICKKRNVLNKNYNPTLFNYGK